MIKNIWFIIGPGGARMDFVAGWLSQTFQNFIKYHWSIDQTNGKSWLFPTIWKSIDRDTSFDQIIKNCENYFKHSTNSVILFPCHGFELKKKLNKTHFQKYNFKFIKINYLESDILSMAWEGLIKNNYSFEKTNELFKRVINTDKLVEDFNNSFNVFHGQEKIISENLKYINQFKYDIIMLDYNEIIKNNGSYYIIEKLNLPSVGIESHDFYNKSLIQSFSPVSININNQEFTKEKFAEIYQLHKEKFNVD